MTSVLQQRPRMNADAFLEWQLNSGEKWELHNGFPLKMMVATRNHTRIVGNMHISLSRYLQDKACQPYTDQLAIRIDAYRVFQPDNGVDCDVENASGSDLEYRKPTLVVEVVSDERRDRAKLPFYMNVKSIQYIVYVHFHAPLVEFYTRRDIGWHVVVLSELTDIIHFPKLDAHLTLEEIYRGVIFENSDQS